MFVVGGFRLDDERFELVGPDGPVAVEPQVFDVLRHLLASGGALVTKEELLDQVWGDRFVSESALTSRIKQARRAIGDDGATQWAIRTVHGRGYRLAVDVDVLDAGSSVAVSAGPAPGAGPVGATAAPGAAALPLPSAFRPDSRRPFVGRVDELAAALELIDRPSTSGVRGIWLFGEPGIGKTRLAARIAQLAHESGATVLFGRCNEDLPVPYQPVIEALRAFLDHQPPDVGAEVLGSHGVELVRLLPELAVRFGELGAPSPADPDTERYRLFEGVASWLASVGADRPVVLVLDDLHWATASTIQLVDHIVRSPIPTGLTVMVTARDTAPDENSRIAALVGRLVDDPDHEVLRLGGLGAEDVAGILDGVAARADDRDRTPTGTVEDVLSLTAGNPLLILALVAAGDAEGGADGGARADLAVAVGRRLSGLGASVADTLALAAVAGLQFDVRVLAAAADRDELDVIDDLESAAAARLLEEVDADTYRFAHALVRATLQQTFSAARRTRMHARLGEAIEQVYADRLDAHAGELGFHFHAAASLSGDYAAKAVDHLRRLAARAVELLSFAEATDALDRALALVDDPAETAALLLERGAVLARGGQNMPALSTLDDAFNTALQAGSPRLVAEAALAFEDVSWRPGMHGGSAVAKLQRALALTDDADTLLLARLTVALSRAYGYTGNVSAADAVNVRAAELAARLGDPELEIRRIIAYLTLTRAAPVPDQSELTWELRDLVRRTPSVGIELDLLSRQLECFELARTGRMREFRRCLDAGTAAIADLHHPFWSHVMTTLGVMEAFHRGDLALAERLAGVAVDGASALPGEDTSGSYGLQMFLIRREQDRLASLAPMLEVLTASNPADSFWAPGLAALCVEIGDLARAATILDRYLTADLEARPVDATWSTVVALLAEVAVAVADPAGCERLLPLLEPSSGAMTMTGHGSMTLGAVDRHLGMLARTIGDLDRAESWLLAAEALEDSNDSTLFGGHARLELAHLAMLRGDEARARDLSSRVEHEAAVLGHAALARRARAVVP